MKADCIGPVHRYAYELVTSADRTSIFGCAVVVDSVLFKSKAVLLHSAQLELNWADPRSPQRPHPSGTLEQRRDISRIVWVANSQQHKKAKPCYRSWQDPPPKLRELGCAQYHCSFSVPFVSPQAPLFLHNLSKEKQSLPVSCQRYKSQSYAQLTAIKQPSHPRPHPKPLLSPSTPPPPPQHHPTSQLAPKSLPLQVSPPLPPSKTNQKAGRPGRSNRQASPRLSLPPPP